MALRAPNPFMIEPSKADFTPILQGIGSMIKESRDAKLKQENKDALMAAYKGGNPDDVAALIAEKPELAGSLNTMIGFRNDKTEKGFNDMVRNIARDPENTEKFITDRIENVIENDGNPVQSVMMLDQYQNRPDSFNDSLLLLASGMDSKFYDALKLKMGVGGDNFKQQEIDIKKGALSLRKIESELRQDEIKLKREDNQLNREKMQLDIDAKRESIVRIKQEIQKKAKAEIRQQASLGEAIDTFIGNDDYMNAVTGWRGRSPSITDTGVEAEAYFDNIKNNLTLENLDKMSGVLSETDIKILSTAATAMQIGMGKPAMLREMRKIKNVLKDKSAEVQKMILSGTDQPVGDASQSADSEAVKWAKSNPDDPRAIKIMQMQGVQ